MQAAFGLNQDQLSVLTEGLNPADCLHCIEEVKHPVEELSNHMDCKSINHNGCEYYKCSGKLADYPQEINVLLPKDKMRARENYQYHFHGHRFGNQYDLTPEHLIKNMQLDQNLCTDNAKTIIVPFSYGKCEDFDKYFKSIEDFKRVHNDLLAKSKTEQMPILTLSAHSGGGRALSKIIQSSDIPIQNVKLYDAIYSSWQPQAIKDWYNKTDEAQLSMINVAPKGTTAQNYQSTQGASPYNYSKKLFNDLSVDPQHRQIELNSNTLNQFQSTQQKKSISFAFENSTSCNHYTVLNHWFRQ